MICHIEIHVKVCIHVCTYVRMSCVCAYVLYLHVCLSVWRNECMNECMNEWMHECMYVCTYVSMYVCMHACMYVSLHAKRVRIRINKLQWKPRTWILRAPNLCTPFSSQSPSNSGKCISKMLELDFPTLRGSNFSARDAKTHCIMGQHFLNVNLNLKHKRRNPPHDCFDFSVLRRFDTGVPGPHALWCTEVLRDVQITNSGHSLGDRKVGI